LRHSQIVPEKEPIGKLDPSRVVVRGVVDMPAAGLDDQAAPPDYVGSADWQRDVGDGGLRYGTPGCNIVARGRSASKSRRLTDIVGYDKLAAGGPPLLDQSLCRRPHRTNPPAKATDDFR